MANFLEDYSGINAAGSAVQGFIKGMNDMDDRSMKKQEFDAKMKAMQTQADREALNKKIEMRAKHIAQGPDGSLTDTPLSQNEQETQDLGAQEKGIATTRDESGRRTFSYDPNSPQSRDAAAKEYASRHAHDAKPLDWKKFTAALDPNQARGGNLAKSQGMVNAADRVEALFKQFPDGNMPKTQSVEAGTAIASLISGGSPQSQQQIHDIVPGSASGSAADIASWWSNNPTGREQQEFMKILHETSKRERAVASRQVLEAQRARLTGLEDYKSQDPDHYYRALDGYHITEHDDPNAPLEPVAASPTPGLVNRGLMGRAKSFLFGDAIVPQAQAASAPPSAHPDAPDAMAWAKNPKSPGWTKAKADEIINRLGGK